VAPFTGRTKPSGPSGPDSPGPRERKGDPRSPAGAPRRADRRAASGCLWDACEALLSAAADPAALERALDALQTAFDCDGVSLHALSPEGTLDPCCACGEWERSPGDLREALGVPLFRGNDRVGALDLLARRGQHWRPEQLSLVRTASGALGAALGARLELERLRRQPGRDTTTGLADARAFHHRLVEEMGRAESDGTPLAVVTLDLDLFTGVNEKFGNATGDQVLAECALVLKLALREGDFLARLGGDEYGVVLPDCDLAPARRLAERLRHALEEHRFPRVGSLSVSAGVAASPRDGMDPTELLAAAERALGLAKKAGRHRTAASGPSQTH
jgi:diguanylate cyclase (GGDEF)-like protein